MLLLRPSTKNVLPSAARKSDTTFCIVADFVIVHLSMVVASAATVIYHTALGHSAVASRLITDLASYYLSSFWPLSLLFPPAFYLAGFYTRGRAYRGWRKLMLLSRGCAMTVLLFIAANFILFQKEPVPRSVAAIFCALILLGTASARFTKALMLFMGSTPPSAAGEGKVLVLGGAGYIGSILVRRLLERNERVRVLDSLVYGDEAIRDILHHPRLELIIGDCRNIQSVVAAVKGVDRIVDLAAIVGDPACERERQAAQEINYAATRMLIEIAKGNGVKRLIFASSCSVYGASDGLLDEQSAMQPISLYAKTKIDSETALLNARSETFHPTVLRLATVFGNSYRPRFDLVINLLTAKACQEHLITIYNGEQWRPFIHVRDICEGILRVMDAPLEAVSGEVFNLGDTRLNFTLMQIAEKIRAVFPETRIEQVENTDRRNYRVSFDKVHKRLGFSCRWTVEAGIRELRQAFEEGEIQNYQDAYYSNIKFLQARSSPPHASEADARVMAAFSANGMAQSV